MKRYDVVINGISTTLLLSDEDARARGLHTSAPKSAPAEPVATKTRAPANKSRRPANKTTAAKDD